MTPTPVTFVSPTAPAAYQWEATNDEVAARYGVPVERIIRFDLNTSPAPPELASRVLAGGRFETTLSEYPPSDYRRLVEAAAGVYRVAPENLLVGAGADEILDLAAKTFLPSTGAAVVPVPTYAMYHVLTSQRGARSIAVPRLGPAADWALDAEAVRAAAREAEVVWLCSPNNPTGRSEPPGAIEALLADLATDAAAAGREVPAVVLDEAYAEIAGHTLIPLVERYPNLVVVRTASKAYALAGLRVGFAIARAETIGRMAPYRPPGSVATTSVTVVTEALLDGSAMRANVARIELERGALREALTEAGWTVGGSETNFVVADFGTPERAATVAEGLLRRGLVPRTFGAGHLFARCLRLTVRDAAGNDRLVAAARDLATEGVR